MKTTTAGALREWTGAVSKGIFVREYRAWREDEFCAHVASNAACAIASGHREMGRWPYIPIEK